MKYLIKTKNSADRRKWDIKETENRLDVVNALGRKFSPKDAEEIADGKWHGIQREVHIMVIK